MKNALLAITDKGDEILINTDQIKYAVRIVNKCRIVFIDGDSMDLSSTFDEVTQLVGKQ